jgi:hypothetical protein
MVDGQLPLPVEEAVDMGVETMHCIQIVLPLVNPAGLQAQVRKVEQRKERSSYRAWLQRLQHTHKLPGEVSYLSDVTCN